MPLALLGGNRRACAGLRRGLRGGHKVRALSAQAPSMEGNVDSALSLCFPLRTNILSCLHIRGSCLEEMERRAPCSSSRKLLGGSDREQPRPGPESMGGERIHLC